MNAIPFLTIHCQLSQHLTLNGPSKVFIDETGAYRIGGLVGNRLVFSDFKRPPNEDDLAFFQAQLQDARAEHDHSALPCTTAAA